MAKGNIVVTLRPGTAADKSIKYIVPAELAARNPTVEEIVQFSLKRTAKDGASRDDLRLAERVNTEMAGDARYGVTINGIGVRDAKKECLSAYLVDAKSPKGKPYKKADIIVAARQSGATGLEYRAL